MNLKFKKLDPRATTPFYGSLGAACFDITCLATGTVRPMDAWTFDTGLAFEIPEGHVMLVYSRSGHGFNHATRLANCTGVIDSDYRGELKVKLFNDGDHSLYINAGDRVAQAMVVPVDRVSFKEVEELSDTDRGTGGFGSTGA